MAAQLLRALRPVVASPINVVVIDKMCAKSANARVLAATSSALGPLFAAVDGRQETVIDQATGTNGGVYTVAEDAYKGTFPRGASK